MFRRIPKNVVVLGLVSFFNDVASEMIYPIVPIFLTSILHAPVAVVGLIEGIAEGSASIFKFIFGYLSDKTGKRKGFVISGYAFGALSKLLIGLASVWPLVLLARFIDRLGKGLRTSPRDAMLLQSASPTNRGFIFGFHRALDSLGAVIGPLLALLLLDMYRENMRTIFFIAFIPAAVAVALIILFAREKKQENQKKLPPLREMFRWKHLPKPFLWFFLISILFTLGNSSDAFLILRARSLGFTVTLAVLTYVLYNVSQTIFATPAGQLADRIGARRVYAAGLLIYSLVYLGFGLISHPFWIWFLFPIYGLYIAFTDGVSKAYIADYVDQTNAGSYFGIYQTGISLAGFLASVIGGVLWSTFFPAATFYFGSLLAFLAFLMLLVGKFRYHV